MNIIHSPDMPNSNGHYSQCIEHNGLLYLSGQLPINPDTKSISDNIEEQASQALSNINAVLSAAGCSKNDVIQMRIYLVGINHWDQVNEIYSRFFNDHKPARCIVPVPELHFGSLIEIEAISAINN